MGCLIDAAAAAVRPPIPAAERRALLCQCGQRSRPDCRPATAGTCATLHTTSRARNARRKSSAAPRCWGAAAGAPGARGRRLGAAKARAPMGRRCGRCPGVAGAPLGHHLDSGAAGALPRRVRHWGASAAMATTKLSAAMGRRWRTAGAPLGLGRRAPLGAPSERPWGAAQTPERLRLIDLMGRASWSCPPGLRDPPKGV